MKDHGNVVAEIPNRELADEAPLYDRPHTAPLRRAPMDAPHFASADLNADLANILASPDICSKHWIWRQYDYMVRTNTLAGPGGDAAIVRMKETGIVYRHVARRQRPLLPIFHRARARC